MPSLELAAGQVVTAAHTNTYWMRQVIATGLSSARPSPYEGRAAYDTDTDALVIYTTATTGWRPPWNLPWGFIASDEISSDTTQSGTDIALASMIVRVIAGRRYRINMKARCSSVAGVTPNIGVLHWYPAFTTGAANLTAYRSTILTGTSADFSTGAETEKMVGSTNIFDAVATGNVTVQAKATTYAMVAKWNHGSWIDVEDIGPASSPP